MNSLDPNVKNEFDLLLDALQSSFKTIVDEIDKRDMVLLRLAADNPNMKADELVAKYKETFPTNSIRIDVKRLMNQIRKSKL